MKNSTKDLMEEVLYEDLNKLKNLEYFDDEETNKERKEIQNEINLLTSKLLEYDKLANESLKAICEGQTSNRKEIVDIVKTLLPILMLIIYNNHAETRLLRFEETGKITSKVGRDFKLPKIF